MKKIALLLIACLLLSLSVAFVSCSDTEEVPTESESATAAPTAKPTAKPTARPTENGGDNMNGKSIDIYIVAGQSNGSGYTKINVSTLTTLWNRASVGNRNVLYAGRAEYTSNGATMANEMTWCNARAGQGIGAGSMGVEVGMAKVLYDEYYNEDSEKVAGILKFAHGGTSLFDNKGGENAASGNWVSPSYAQQNGLSYSGLTGGLYRKLLEQVEKNVEELYDLGYTDVNIKGMFWMQGESDRSKPMEYADALELFVSDIRRDLGELMDEDLSALPFMVGEISRTSGSADEDTVKVNEMFIAMQRDLEYEIPNLYVIASGQFEINKWDESTNSSVIDPYQNDAWHWNTECMFAIGELVGQCIVDKIVE